jgi:phospholipase/carboxylesterase
MNNDLLIQQPSTPTQGHPGTQLLLMFHGVGADPQGLVGLGEQLATAVPQAWIVSIRSPQVSDLGRGWQWFSVLGITEENRPARIAAAMPLFKQTLARWQARAGVPPERTARLGFSQGANMALAFTQEPEMLASKVIAIAGRYATLPTRGHPQQQVHLLHGDRDPVMPVAHSIDAAAQRKQLGLPVTLDVFSHLAHAIDERVVNTLRNYLAAP